MTSKKVYYNSMKNNVKRIFIDMDGVLADFLRGVEKPEYIGHPLTKDDAGHTE